MVDNIIKCETNHLFRCLEYQSIEQSQRMKAVWNRQVLADSKDTVVVENNHYFPASSLNMEFFKPSDSESHCPWKGEASCYSMVVDGVLNKNAAWYYPAPNEAAKEIKGRVAFWRGVEVIE